MTEELQTIDFANGESFSTLTIHCGEKVSKMTVHGCIVVGNTDRLLDIQEMIDDYKRLRDLWAEQFMKKYGNWVFTGTKDVYKCSICGNFLDFDGVNGGRGDKNYCPNCGAKMKYKNGVN